MNSFLISISPKFVGKIFNGDKTIEIRRTAPKDWKEYLSGKTKIKPEPRTGYIYCTKGEPFIQVFNELQHHGERFAPRCVLWKKEKSYPKYFPYGEYAKYFCSQCKADLMRNICNGKVVAKFTLREVESIYITDKLHCRCEEHEWQARTPSLSPDKLCESSCLSEEEIWDYLTNGNGYAYHISDLQIFHEPKEIKEFYEPHECGELPMPITKAPQSWRYVEATE